MTTTPPEVRQFGVHLRAAEGRTIIGKAAPYGEMHDIGSFHEQLQPGCFKKSIREAARALPLLALHDHQSIPVGKATKWTEADDGLYGEWLMDTRAEAREMLRLVEEDLMGGLSVGFVGIRSDWSEDGPKPAVIRHEARLLEVSLVPVPAFAPARVLAVRSAGVPDNPGTAIIPTPRLDAYRAWFVGRAH
jgi:HK97 family phage prohead protease